MPPDLERWLRTRWESGAHSSSADRSIDLAFCSKAPWKWKPPHDHIETTALDGATLTWLRHGERWWSTGRTDTGVELRLFDDRTRISVWDVNRSGSMSLALHVAMSESLRARGLVPLHGAVVVRDGRATAIVGRSGVGKSTTLLSSMDQGWVPLAEDFAWLDPMTHRVYAWTGEHGVRLGFDSLHRLPIRLQLAGWRRQHDGKFFLPYEEFAPARPAFAELTRVVALHREPALKSGFEPLSMREATRVVWECAGVPLCRVTRDAFAAQVPLLLSRLEWSRLVLGRGTAVL